MTATELVLSHFDRIGEAADAVSRLRRFVLDLAVRGKIVDQDPADEPAIALLGAFRKLATQIRRTAPPVTQGGNRNNTDGLFQLPSSWTWCQLSEVGMIVAGGTPPSKDPDNFAQSGQGIPWLTPADLGREKKTYVSRGARDLSAKGLESSSATLLPKGSVLFTSRAPIGYTAIAANEITTNQGFKSVVPYMSECSRYIALYFRAFAPWIDERASGTTFREVSGKVVAGLPFPLPPLAEQHRIVAKVDELMALCDRLEAAQKERESCRDRLVGASLARLNEPADPHIFREYAAFLLQHVRHMTSSHAHIDRLRQTLLDLAVQGKLVEQHPNDEPASEWLHRIARERAALVGKGLIRREKPIRPVDPSEPSYALPTGWSWCRIADAVLFTQYGTSEKSSNAHSGVPVLAMGNIRAGAVICNDLKTIPETSKDLPALLLKRFDILYNRTNSAELVGKTGIYLGDDDVRTFASYLIRLRPSLAYSDPRYINIAMNAPVFRATQIAPFIKKQTGQANVNGTALRNMLVPMPSLGEQNRIVAKIDELMAMCDLLESQLESGRMFQGALLEAVLTQVVQQCDAATQTWDVTRA